MFLQRQDLHLSQELALDENGEANAFSLLFTNFLRIQFTTNHLIQEAIEKERPGQKELFNVLILFVILRFETDPMNHFWSLDEVIADYALPVLKAIHEAETEL